MFRVLYVLCSTRPRYQVSVYRTIGPLVCLCNTNSWYFFLTGDKAKVKHFSFPRLSHALPRECSVVTNDLVHHAKAEVQEKHAYCIDCGGKSPWFNAQVTCDHSLLGWGIAGILVSGFAKPSICPALRGYSFEQNAAKSHTLPAAKCATFTTSVGVESNLLYNGTAAPQLYETRGLPVISYPGHFVFIIIRTSLVISCHPFAISYQVINISYPGRFVPTFVNSYLVQLCSN